MLGAARQSTRTSSAAATDRTNVAFPTPSAPDRSTPSWAVAPSRASSSGRWNARSNHSASVRACACAPMRSVTGIVATSSSGATTGAGAGVSTVDTGRVPSRQLTTVDCPTATAPTGSVAVTVSSSLVHVAPIARDSCPRTDATSAPGGGARSCGSRDTASPTVTTFPINASRRVFGETDALASREPATVTLRAADTPAGATTTSAPSVTPRLDIVTSSTSTTPGVPAAVGGCGERGRAAGAGEVHGVPRAQPERVEHLRVQPDHTAADVQRGRGVPQGQGDLGLAHVPTLRARRLSAVAAQAHPAPAAPAVAVLAVRRERPHAHHVLRLVAGQARQPGGPGERRAAQPQPSGCCGRGGWPGAPATARATPPGGSPASGSGGPSTGCARGTAAAPPPARSGGTG